MELLAGMDRLDRKVQSRIGVSPVTGSTQSVSGECTNEKLRSLKMINTLWFLQTSTLFHFCRWQRKHWFAWLAWNSTANRHRGERRPWRPWDQRFSWLHWTQRYWDCLFMLFCYHRNRHINPYWCPDCDLSWSENTLVVRKKSHPRPYLLRIALEKQLQGESANELRCSLQVYCIPVGYACCSVADRKGKAEGHNSNIKNCLPAHQSNECCKCITLNVSTL